MKKMAFILTIVLAMAFSTVGLRAQKPLTGEEYFNGLWTVTVEMAPEYVGMVSFYNDEENKFVGSLSGYDGAITMLQDVKVEGNVLSASTFDPEVGTINIKIEKKDENTATGNVMDGASGITCTRYIPEN